LQAEVVWAAREEMARTVEDVLARRTRALLLDSSAAAKAAPRVAEILAKELRRDASWQMKQVEDFCTLAKIYQLRGTN
jgi:glycerol-3-phosphate dehydrogenase